MRRALVVTALAVIALGLGLGILLYRGTGVAWLQGPLERQLSAALDRELRFLEAPRLRLRDSLTLSGGGLTLANAPWAGDEPLLTLRDIVVRIDTASLFSGPLIIEDVALGSGALRLARDAAGRSNLPAPGADKPPAQEAPDDGPAGSGIPALLLNAQIANFTVSRVWPGHETLELRLHSLRQHSDGERSTLSASGSLQDRDWAVDWDGSPLIQLLDDRPLAARFSGRLADLELNGELALPALDRLADLSLQARMAGSVPPRVAALSPLIDAHDPMLLSLVVRDIDPGLALELDVDLAGLEMAVSGELSRPEDADGVALEIEIDAASLPRLAAALELGETDDVPLTVSGKLARDGRALSLRDMAIAAGEHSITASADIPSFPRSSGATLEFVARGPAFAFYQRLLQRPKLLAEPYMVDASLKAGDDGRARLRASAVVGGHQLDLQGPLGDFPAFNDSDLEIALSGPSLAFIGDQFEVALPARPYRLEGGVGVSDERVSLRGLRAVVTAATVGIDGSLRSYPALDELDLTLTLESDSLADSGAAWGLETLGEVPARASARLSGSAAQPALERLSVSAGESSLRSTGGALRLSADGLASDLVFDVRLAGLPALLGSFGHADMPDTPLSFTLTPALDEQVLSLRLDTITGEGISGNARLQIARDFSLDEHAATDIDLRFASPAALLPPTGPYRAPAAALHLSADTQRSSSTRTLRLQLESATGQLNGVVRIPLAEAEPTRFSLSGEGPRLREFGEIDAYPAGPLPFRLQASGLIREDMRELELQDLTIAGTTAQGSASLIPGSAEDGDKPRINARLEIPRAELDRWLQASRAEALPQAAGAPADSATEAPGDGRLIPDIALPTEWLNAFSSTVHVATGPLGLQDRRLDNRSLIDSLTLDFSSGSGRAALAVSELRGSRGVSSGSVSLDASSAAPRADITLKTRELPLGMGADDDYLRELPLYAVDVDISARGSTSREMAASLDGSLLVTGSAGTLNNISLSFATESFLAQLASTLLPGIEKRPDMQVECSVLAARAEQGVIALDPGFVLRTRGMDMSARGEIDLRSERLRVRFDNQARKGLGVSAASLVNPYVQITGTLARPTVGLDIKGSAIAGGAAAASGGLTVIARPLLGRFLKRGNPCEAAVAHWEDTAPAG